MSRLDLYTIDKIAMLLGIDKQDLITGKDWAISDVNII